MKQNKMTRIGTCLMMLGLFLFLIAVLLFGYNLWENQRAKEYSSEILQQFPQQQSATQPADGESESDALTSLDVPLFVKNPDMEMPTIEIDGNLYIGQLDIPSLELLLPVMSEWSYPNLKLAPCRYSGSAYKNNLIIAAHNYESHFGTLKKLSIGDTIRFTDVDGNVFTYEVAEIEQLNPTDIAEMKDGGWALTLFTCTIGGSYRVTIRCVLA